MVKVTTNDWAKSKGVSHDFLLAFIGFSLFYAGFFSPILFSDLFIGPYDGISYYIPAFYSARELWSNLIFSGYPVAADPQMMTWYPVARLFYYIPNGWNLFVVSGYILASVFNFVYVRTITSSRLAGIIAAFTYGLSGFMFSHLGHITMIHGAAWLPLILLSFEKLRHASSRFWSVMGVVAVACAALSGHPQISFYILALSVYYAIYIGLRDKEQGWRRYAKNIVLVMILSIGLCSIQILPTFELSQLSSRAEMSYERFISYSLPLSQSAMLFFPFIFGGFVDFDFGPYSIPYWAQWNLAEISGYVGLLPLILTVSALGVIGRKRKMVIFWGVVALLSLALSFGDDLFLARLFHNLPGYNRFRAQGRHLIEFHFAISVLAGFGVAVIRSQRLSLKQSLKAIGVIAGLMFGTFGIALLNPRIRTTVVTSWPWENPALYIPLLILLGSSVAILVWRQWPRSRWSSALLMLMLLIDLSSFSRYTYWIPFAPPKSFMTSPPELAKAYAPILNAEHQRILDPRGAFIVPETGDIFPNMNRLWNLPSVGGYSPLLISRWGDFLNMDEGSGIGPLHLSVELEDRRLDVAGVKYLVLQSESSLVPAGGDVISARLPPLSAGSCASHDTLPQLNLLLPEELAEQRFSEIKMVSALGCSEHIVDNEDVISLKATHVDGQVEEIKVKAGRDTSEAFYDCDEVLPLMKHSRANISKSSDVVWNEDTVCKIHEYEAVLPLKSSLPLKNLELNWIAESGRASIHGISFTESSTQDDYQLPLVHQGAKDFVSRWKEVETYGDQVVYENQQVMPRAWLVPRVSQVSPEEIPGIIKQSMLSDGTRFDPEDTALVEDSVTLDSQPLAESDQVQVIDIQAERSDYLTQLSHEAFLVVSDTWYPGWKARVDGKEVPIYRTNYVARGIKVPAGEHQVTFTYEPMSFKLGAGLSFASLALGGFWLMRLRDNEV